MNAYSSCIHFAFGSPISPNGKSCRPTCTCTCTCSYVFVLNSGTRDSYFLILLLFIQTSCRIEEILNTTTHEQLKWQSSKLFKRSCNAVDRPSAATTDPALAIYRGREFTCFDGKRYVCVEVLVSTFSHQTAIFLLLYLHWSFFLDTIT